MKRNYAVTSNLSLLDFDAEGVNSALGAFDGELVRPHCTGSGQPYSSLFPWNELPGNVENCGSKGTSKTLPTLVGSPARACSRRGRATQGDDRVRGVSLR